MSKPIKEGLFAPDTIVLPKSEKELKASFCALQVALQTMKERCQQLQQRLSTVEDENLRLRIEKQRLNSNNLPEHSNVEINTLQEQVAQLTRQKSQLTHHIYMVATENKQLWMRLSKLTEANHSLGNHLNKISDTLNKHSLGETSKPNQSIHIMNSCEKEAERTEQKEESLEEISLKIISSIMREKMELEQQCDQMSALQNGTLSVEDYDFPLGSDADPNEREEVSQDMRRILDNLRDQREQLIKQQSGLRTVLLTLTSVVKNGKLCQSCRTQAKDSQRAVVMSLLEPPVDNHDKGPSQVEGQFDYFDEDRICPLCSQYFSRSTKFEEFHSHVLTHFSDEDADIDSMIATNYEIVN